MFDIQHRFAIASPFSSLSVIFVSEHGAHIRIHASRKQLFWRLLTDESCSSIVYGQRQRKLKNRSVYCFSSVLGSASRKSKLNLKGLARENNFLLKQIFLGVCFSVCQSNQSLLSKFSHNPFRLARLILI